MPSILNEKDRELLISNEPIDYEAPAHAYLGGSFGTNENDYVEVLIYDVNDNFLESGIVDESDYHYSEEKQGMKLKTGTILRKMGYDRGRFVVKYNFFRRQAGSHETILVDKSGNTLIGEPDLNELGKSIFLKENKYLIHEISDTRQELRLVSQNIRDDKYLRDFYKLPRKIKKFRADFTGDSKIEFKGSDGIEPKDSKTIGFKNPPGFAEPDGRFEPAMVGGKIMIPNFFLRRIEYPPPTLTGEDMGIHSIEKFVEDEFQASFFMNENLEVGEFKKNAAGSFGDRHFYKAFQEFKDFDDNDVVTSYGVDFKDGNTLNAVKNLSDSTFNCVYLKWKDPRPIVVIESNSFIPADVPTSYVWEITGFDNDGGTYRRIQPKYDSTGADTGGNIEILGGQDDAGRAYAEPSSTNLLKAVGEVVPPDNPRENERQGSRLRFKLWGKDLHIGIRLTIVENSTNQISTLHLPAIIETD